MNIRIGYLIFNFTNQNNYTIRFCYLKYLNNSTKSHILISRKLIIYYGSGSVKNKVNIIIYKNELVYLILVTF